MDRLTKAFGACKATQAATAGAIISTHGLGMPFECESPFLFAVYHHDKYPSGNERLGPNASIKGRSSADFGKEWNMYHGAPYGIPGFPRHPHRGFETITITRHGIVDHADSLGNYGRFGLGDVQWMSAAKGVCHSEMFPLLNREEGNLLELFQIWLNLPNRNKMGEPGYAMLWHEDLPKVARKANEEKGEWRNVDLANPLKPTEVGVTLIGGELPGMAKPPPPPPGSLGADPENGIMVATVQLPSGSAWTLPAYKGSTEGLHRNIYFFSGSGASVDGESQQSRTRVKVRPDMDVQLTAGGTPADFLILQGRDLGEPVVQGGPFVAASRDELIKADRDFRTTGFGGWQYDSDAPVQAREAPRFMTYADGSKEERKI
mmetsp:Transcript_11144/g.24589  ORF Transcript_11144/g.24589 Transcript_11144/m.24589 type:complete len:375 (-) Transcript_11144:156-1280(-)